MKRVTLTLTLVMSIMSFAHDQGHGPKLSDSGKYGGSISGVILKTEVNKGSSATLVHKAELVRSADGVVRVYLYDKKMKPLDLNRFDLKARASLVSKVKGKLTESLFTLEQKETAFVGKMPNAASKPYSIDIIFKEGRYELLTAFDNLD